MPDSISCPHCRHVLSVPAEHEGREIRCPECQRMFGGAQPSAITAQAPVLTPISSDVQPGLPPFRAAALDEDDDRLDHVSIGPDYRPANGLALTAKVFLGLNLAVSFLLLGSNYLQYQLAQRLIAHVNVPDAELVENDDRQLLLVFVHVGVFLLSAIVFLMWFHRAHANLPALGARNLTYTSGWAVGCWFVPFMNLVRPVQIAQEIWRNSDPNAVAGRDIRVETAGNSALIGFWWATWIGSNIISNITARLAGEVKTPEALQSATVGNMIAEVASIVAAVFALAVVASIDSRQTARADVLAARDRDA